MGSADDIDSLLALGPDDLHIARRSASIPGAADPFILRSGLRIERRLDTIAALLTEIRDRLPAPTAAPAIEPPPAPLPGVPPRRHRGS